MYNSGASYVTRGHHKSNANITGRDNFRSADPNPVKSLKTFCEIYNPAIVLLDQPVNPP